jgi:myotubularin-related protein 6/7/8
MQVDNVVCTKQAVSSLGTLHLTAHHLIFRYDNDNEEEMWVSPVSFFARSFADVFPFRFHTRSSPS